MADTVRYYEPSSGGQVIATRQQTGGEHIQRITLAHRTDVTGVTTALQDVARDAPLPVTDVVDGPVPISFSSFLANGAVINGNVDYSVTPGTFSLSPPSDEIWRVNALTIVIAMNDDVYYPEGYGTVNSPLVNGITVQIQNDLGTVLDVTDGDPVVTQVEWSARSPIATVLPYNNPVGTDYTLLAFLWNFRELSAPLRIDGTDNNGRLEVVLNDDFSNATIGLVSHYFLAHGYIEGSEL